ncbi:synaptonemal complex protein 2 isoform X5 [Nothobranchius furzeri]|uniref:synaptonemal complex protein 2 isoform X5 n=1 Tax=Nothobranchius furzeri TaxID=105023 RepID=UPI003904AD29
MAPSQSEKLDNIIDEVLKSGNRQPLEAFLERYTDKEVPVKCSQKFLSKLDKLITKSLDQKDARTASLAVAIIYKCGKNLDIPGGRGLSGLITQRLMNKMVQWFEKCKLLWIQHGPLWDETMFTLSENFFNALMVAHESCREGTFKVTEFFLYPIGQLAVDPKIYILIQKEAIRKYNLILDKIPVEFKKTRQILTSQEAADLMAKLATRILEGGDYDLQSSLMEALCRMATAEQRKKLASHWFSMGRVASAFAQINDSEFETACRGFLNMVNGMQGDRRRVYSYPCLEVYLGKYELLKPVDEKLAEFWIDFNLGSHSISFYFSLSGEEESHWETICINENEVQSYTVREEGKRKVLQIKLSEVVFIGTVEGSSLTIQFSSSLDILQAAQSVYGLNCVCVCVRACVRACACAAPTQVVPESQVSYGESEKKPAPYVLPAPAAPVQMVTPARIRLSESTVCISSSERGTTRSVSSLVLKPPDKDRSSVEKKIFVAEAKQVGVTGQEEENCQDNYFVPDTQPRVRDNVSFRKSSLSVSEMLMMPTQKMGSAPRPVSNLRVLGPLERCPSSAQRWSVSDSDLVLQKKLHSELTQRLQHVLTERKTDPQYQEESACQTNASKSRGNSKDRGSGTVPGSSLQSPNVKQVRRNDQRKGQRTLEADTVPEETSDKTSAGKNKPNRKESEKDADVTASMMKRISSHYEINTRSKAKDTIENNIPIWNPPRISSRAVFTMSMVYSGRKEAPKDASLRKSFTKTTTDSVSNIKDIFAFNNDSPVGIGGVNRTLNKTFDTSKSSSVCLSTNKAQPKPVAKKKRYVKEHLFSDTDTDNAPTEVSWLKKSARRSKPQVTKYPKQALKKPKAASPSSLHTFPDVLPSVQKDSKGDKKPKALNPPKMVEQAPRRPHAAGRRSRQAAASSAKSYQEPDTDDDQSEAEKPQPPKITSTDDLKSSGKIQDTVQTKKNTTTSKPTSKKLQLHPASETSPPTKTHRGGLQENREKFDEDLQMKKKTVNMSEESYRRTDTISRADSKKQNIPKAQQVKPGKALHKTLKSNKKSVVHAREETSALKDSLAASQTSFCLSPPPIEGMRSVERSAPTLDLTFPTVLTPRESPLPASPKPPCQETPSPIPLLPKLHSAVGSKEKRKPSSLHKAEKGHRSSKIQFIKSIPSPCSVGGQTPAPSPPTGPDAAEMCAVQQHLSSALPSPLFTQPLLTSSLLVLDQPPVALPPLSPLAENSISQGCQLEFSNSSPLSLGPSSRSLAPGRKSKERSMATMIDSSKSEKTPLTDKGTELSQPLVSGPTRKRRVSLSSHSDEDETEQKVKSRKRRQNSPRMKPRKLFKSFTEMSTTDEFSHISSFNWEAEEAGGDVDLDEGLELPPTGLNTSDICHQWGSKLKIKLQSQCNIMESYNKQSLKTMQQHVTSINVKLCKYRTQKLEQIKKVLLEEIHHLEQDDVLKNMEKDLNSHWKKQMTAFHSHQKQETRRIDTLRGTFGSCQSLESEERIFSSEMDLVRKEMKSIQDRVLNEMLEGEIQSVKRGLHALFFP